MDANKKHSTAPLADPSPAPRPFSFFTKASVSYMIAAFIYIADQASKLAVRTVWVPDSSSAIEVTSFFNIVHAWNYGVSFSLFSDAGDARRWTLVGIMCLISLVIIYWLHHAHTRMQSLAYGLILGGAIGNIADRVMLGAVFDFLQFHLAEYYWPSFNVADSAIVVGVGLLLLDGFLRREKKNA